MWAHTEVGVYDQDVGGAPPTHHTTTTTTHASIGEFPVGITSSDTLPSIMEDTVRRGLVPLGLCGQGKQVQLKTQANCPTPWHCLSAV